MLLNLGIRVSFMNFFTFKRSLTQILLYVGFYNILKRPREEKGVGEDHEDASLKCDKEVSRRTNKVFLNTPFCHRLSVSHLQM